VEEVVELDQEEMECSDSDEVTEVVWISAFYHMDIQR
jgi:hypothetical protein